MMSNFTQNTKSTARINKKNKRAASLVQAARSGVRIESLEKRTLLSALLPSQVTQAYGINQIMYGSTVGNGAGQTIAIIDPGDDSALANTGSANFDSSDLYQFDHLSGINLPDPPSFTVIGENGGARPAYIGIATATESGTTVTITTATPDGLSTGSKVSIAEAGDGGYDGSYLVDSTPTATTFTCTSTAANPPTGLPNSTGGTINNPVDDGETTLDVEWAHAIAPAANIVLIECSNGLYDGDITNAVNTAVSIGASVVSMSFSGGESSSDTGTNITSLDDGLFARAGVTFIASTGDNGAPAGYPAYSPNVLAIGATNLYLNADNSYNSETGWSNPAKVGGNAGGSGGGISAYEPQPAYQQGTVTKVTQSTTYRTAPDVSFVGGSLTRVQTYDSFGGGLVAEAGTSVGAPCWAGLIAIADQGAALDGKPPLNSAAAGFAGQTTVQKVLYNSPLSSFHDITSGYNGYNASSGYDLVTGIGSPVANLLLPELAFYGYISSSDFVVTNTNDSGPGSLRQAITYANFFDEPQNITFDIPTTDHNYSNGVFTIKPQTSLPTITDPDVTIDGSTEPNSATLNGGRPVIFLNGANQNINGLVLSAGSDVVNDLGVDDFAGTLFGGGIIFSGAGAGGDSVQNCLIGIGPAGFAASAGNTVGVSILNAATNFVDDDVIGFNTDGILVLGGTGNYIVGDSIGISSAYSAPNGTGILLTGPTNVVYDNQIDCNTGDGISISGSASTGNTVQDNTIGVEPATGTNESGYLAVPNGGDGIQITGGADNNLIGGNTATSSTYPNLIAGNTGNGIEIDGSSGNVVQSNTIGYAIEHYVFNGSHTVNNPNGGEGILIDSASTGNTIGGGGSTEGNTISGNGGDGIEIAGTSNTVGYNVIGTNPAGTAAAPNAQQGVYITGNSNVVNENTISGNGQQGVEINGSSYNIISGNGIGMNSAYAAAVPNQLQGVLVTGTYNTVSGDVIGGNVGAGIALEGNNNTVYWCYVGINTSGGAVSNGVEGIYIDSSGNLIGGSSYASYGNDISGNTSGTGAGIYLDTASATDNTIEGNYIGTNLTGTAAVGNLYGIMVENDASGNFIGSGGVGNVISGNGYYGVLFATSSNGTVVQSNYIGLNAAGTAAVGNDNGIVAQNSTYGDTIGGLTPGTANTISGNSNDGIYIGSGSTNITVEGNFIGTNPAGTSAIANDDNGMEISASDNTIGGTSPSARNIISGNANGIGVSIYGSGASGNTIEENFIGTNSAGTAAIANDYGVLIELSASGNFVGNASGDIGNVISGNTDDGVLINTSATGNTVTSNYIGTNAAGTAAVPNSSGVEISSGATSDDIYSNLISGNNNDGVSILGTGSSSSTVQGNLIGTDYTGTHPLGNAEIGIYVDSDETVIGGYGSGQGNTIDYSGNAGVYTNSSSASITDCTVYDNAAGGIDNAGTLAIFNSTITGNSAASGAGIYTTGPLQLTGDTIARNTASTTGGGIDVAGGTTSLLDSIVAQNTGGDITGAVYSASYFNLIGDGTGMTGITNSTPGDQIGTHASPINPRLGSLANNGGTTETMAPESGSPAYNAGSGGTSTDQRGVARPQSINDIGAVQHNSLSFSISNQQYVYLRLATDGQTLDIYYNNTSTGTPSYTLLLSDYSSLAIGGTSLNDQLTVDYSNGVPVPSGTGFTYNGLGGTNTLKVIGTSGNDAITFSASTIIVGSSSFTYSNVQSRIVDPLGGSDSLTIASDLTVSFPVAPTGGGIFTRTFSSLTLGTGSALIVPTATTRKTDRTLLVVQSASFGSGATLDVGGNDADFTSTPLSALNALLSTGYSAGSWTGPGIDSSFAATDTTHLTALGVIQNNQGGTPIFSSSNLFDGTVPGAGDVLIKYTYYGDANLDGRVNGTDYSRIDNSVLNHLTGWFNGDFSYNGTINGSDYTLIDNAYNTQGASLAAEVAATTAPVVKPTAAQAVEANQSPEASTKAEPIAKAASLISGLETIATASKTQRKETAGANESRQFSESAGLLVPTWQAGSPTTGTIADDLFLFDPNSGWQLPPFSQQLISA